MRGIHVMQEQPVHADEILSLLRTAKANSACYAVNDFYSRIAPVRQFIAAAKVSTNVRVSVTCMRGRRSMSSTRCSPS